MRWFILPCQKTYTLLSPMLRPMKANLVTSDAVEIGHSNACGAEWISSLTMNTQQLQWPYPYSACLEALVNDRNPQVQTLSKLFMEHCDNPRNWTATSLTAVSRNMPMNVSTTT